MLKNARVAIEGLHDRQPDGSDILERLLRDRLAARRVLSEIAHELLEARVRPQTLLAPFLVGLLPVDISLPPVGAHLEAKIP